MPTFVRHILEVDITSLLGGINVWTEVDLAPFLTSPDAIGVVLRMTDPTATATGHAWREVGGGTAYPFKIFFGHYATQLIGLAGGTSVEIKRGVATIEVYLQGELRAGEGAVLYDTPIEYDFVEAEHNDWQDKQPRPQGGDALGDIAAVLVRASCYSLSNTFGVRQRESANTTQPVRWEGGSNWFVVGVNEDGYYQLYTNGKAGYDTEDVVFHEIGYIRKGSSVVTIPTHADEDLPVTVGFVPLDLSATVGPYAAVAGGQWVKRVGTGEYPAYMRPIGGSERDDSGVYQYSTNTCTQLVSLDDAQHARYTLGDSNIELLIDWYENLLPPDVFLWDADLRPPMAMGSLVTPTFDAMSDRRSPLDAAAPDSKTPMETDSDAKTPLDAEAEPWREET